MDNRDFVIVCLFLEAMLQEKKQDTILSERYQPYHKQGASKYPSSITVIMDNGEHITYKR